MRLCNQGNRKDIVVEMANAPIQTFRALMKEVNVPSCLKKKFLKKVVTCFPILNP